MSIAIIRIHSAFARENATAAAMGTLVGGQVDVLSFDLQKAELRINSNQLERAMRILIRNNVQATVVESEG